MLVQMSRELVANHWSELKEALAVALPPTVRVDNEKLNGVLASIMRDDLQVWGLGSEKGLTAIVATTVTFDNISGERSLLIYSLFGMKLISQEEWLDGLVTLRLYAKAKACNMIIGYTSVRRIVDIVKELGGNTDTVLLKLEV